MNQINIGMRAEEGKREEGVGPGPRNMPNQNTDDDEENEDLDGYDDESLPFFSQVVNRFPKAIDWYYMAITFAGMRAATAFGVTLAYLILISRAVQIVGIFVNKPVVAYVGYGITFFFMIMLFFVTMVHEAD